MSPSIRGSTLACSLVLALATTAAGCDGVIVGGGPLGSDDGQDPGEPGLGGGRDDDGDSDDGDGDDGGGDDGGGDDGGGDGGDEVAFEGPDLPSDRFPRLRHAVGEDLAAGLVTGRMYADLADHAPDRMADLAALGVRVIRVGIETRQVDAIGKWEEYQTIARAARRAGIEVLALVNWNSMAWPGGGQPPDPMALSWDAFHDDFVPRYLEALDRVIDYLPQVRYLEIWNEPDVYWFTPMATWDGACHRTEAARRYGYLLTRAYRHVVARREALGHAAPYALGFSLVRGDDRCVREALVNAPAITAYRADHGGRLPLDIVAMHAYGNRAGLDAALPWGAYTYDGRTLGAGIDAFLNARFDDGTRVVAASQPVWITEVGWGLNWLGAWADPKAMQAETLRYTFAELARRPQITAAFWYDYADDPPESEEENRHGLRDSLARGFAPHPSYAAYQAASVALGDRSPPVGRLESPRPEAEVEAGEEVSLAGWAVDADGAAPVVTAYLDGEPVEVRVAGERAGSFRARWPSATGCEVARSRRCPDVGFEATLTLPDDLEPGTHRLSLVARDAAGNERVIGRAPIIVRP